MKKLILLISVILIPMQIFAYSDEVILGGNTLGIEVKSEGVMIVGFYKVNGKYNKGNPEVKVGDYITKINNESISTIDELTKIIEDSKDEIDITFKRGNREYKTILKLVEEDNIFKTGLYVKDNITGIGTLTYIDPNTKIFGALGHEIIESSSNNMININGGYIFRNSITSIEKSNVGNPGSKNAEFFYDTKYGEVIKNSIYGIYGNYTFDIDNSKLIEIAKSDEVVVGPAQIYTVVSGENIEIFNINITSINETANIKNITFEITDEKLVNATGGVVQGMSGSPIVQNSKLIGAVTHVIVDNPVTGYGLFITTMLEEGES